METGSLLLTLVQLLAMLAAIVLLWKRSYKENPESPKFRQWQIFIVIVGIVFFASSIYTLVLIL